MQEGKTHFAISFWTSLTGTGVLAITALMLFRFRWLFRFYPLLIVTVPLFFGLQISSLAAALLERKSKSALVAIAISLASVGLIIVISPKGSIRIIRFGLPMLFVVSMTAILAGITAIDVKGGRVNKYAAMLILVLTAAVFTAWPLSGRLLEHSDGSPGRIMTAIPCIFLFGPWLLVSDHVFRDVRFLVWAVAIAHTLALIFPAIIVLATKRPRRAAVSMIIFTATLLAWLTIAYVQALDTIQR